MHCIDSAVICNVFQSPFDMLNVDELAVHLNTECVSEASDRTNTHLTERQGQYSVNILTELLY